MGDIRNTACAAATNLTFENFLNVWFAVGLWENILCYDKARSFFALDIGLLTTTLRGGVPEQSVVLSREETGQQEWYEKTAA